MGSLGQLRRVRTASWLGPFRAFILAMFSLLVAQVMSARRAVQYVKDATLEAEIRTRHFPVKSLMMQSVAIAATNSFGVKRGRPGRSLCRGSRRGIDTGNCPHL